MCIEMEKNNWTQMYALSPVICYLLFLWFKSSWCLFRASINMHPGWSHPKWTTLNTCVKTPKWHWGCFWDPITQTTFRDCLDCMDHILLAVCRHMCPWLHVRTAYSTEVLCNTTTSHNNQHNGLYTVWLPFGSLWCKLHLWAFLICQC